jgi:hypothetical protein
MRSEAIKGAGLWSFLPLPIITKQPPRAAVASNLDDANSSSFYTLSSLVPAPHSLSLPQTLLKAHRPE